MQDPTRKLVWRMWGYAYMDRVKFRQSRVCITQADLMKMLKLEESNLKKLPLSELQNLRVIPLEPALPLSPENTILVSCPTRRLAMRLWKETGHLGYQKIVTHTSKRVQ